MTVVGGCRYTFIINRKPFQCPFFAECCRHTKIKLKHIMFYEPNVVYVPKHLEPLVHVLKKVQDANDRTIALDVVCEEMCNKKQAKEVDLVWYQKTVVDAVIHNRLFTKQNKSILTPLQYDTIIKIYRADVMVNIKDDIDWSIQEMNNMIAETKINVLF